MHLSILFSVDNTHQCLAIASTTSPTRFFIVAKFKLPNMNFCSVSVVSDRWVTIWRCSVLTSALPYTGPHKSLQLRLRGCDFLVTNPPLKGASFTVVCPGKHEPV